MNSCWIRASFLNPPTDDAYKSFCKRFKLQPESETLADGTTAHWIGPRTASKVIVNFHGGGYVVPASPEMFQFLYQIQQEISKQEKDVAVIFLAYGMYAAIPQMCKLTHLNFRFGTSSQVSSPAPTGHRPGWLPDQHIIQRTLQHNNYGGFSRSQSRYPTPISHIPPTSLGSCSQDSRETPRYLSDLTVGWFRYYRSRYV